MVRTFASEAGGSGGAGSNLGRVIPKTLKWYQCLPCLALSINKASTGFSSLKKITSMIGAPCNTLFMRCLEYLADRRRTDSRLLLLYKAGLKGKTRIPTDDLIPKNRRCRNQYSLA